jgi:hypothetical protein
MPEKRMKVFLYFPPLVAASIKQPYPSLPLLSAYLKANTDLDVSCRDINADAIDRLIALAAAPGKGTGRGKTLLDGIKGGAKKAAATVLANGFVREGYRRLKRCARYPLINAALMSITKKAVTLSHGHNAQTLMIEGLGKLLGMPLDPETYRILQNNDARTSSSHYLLDYWNLTFDQLRRILTTNEPDPLLSCLGGGYFDEVREEGPVLVGLSIAFFTQFGAAVALARHLKKLNRRAFVAVGGPVIRHVSHNLPRIAEIFDVVDCFVETEGEEVLAQLSRKLSRGEDWDGTPGLIFRDPAGKVVKNPAQPFDLDRNTTPDYSLLRRHRYLEPQNLFLRTSVGCYWDKCRFCTQSLTSYKQRGVEAIVEDMLRLAASYGARTILMSDEAIPFPKLSRIADALIAKGAPVSWSCSSRFDAPIAEDLCRRLAASGCVAMNFGLEAGTQRVNDLMRKGVKLAAAQQVIGMLRKHGITCGVTAMIGFPGETEPEMLETVAFLKGNAHLNFACYISILSLERGSYFFKHPEEFGISGIEEAPEYFYKESYAYTCAGQVPYQRLMEIRGLLS